MSSIRCLWTLFKSVRVAVIALNSAQEAVSHRLFPKCGITSRANRRIDFFVDSGSGKSIQRKRPLLIRNQIEKRR